MVMYCSLKEAWGIDTEPKNDLVKNKLNGSNNNINKFSNGMLPCVVNEKNEPILNGSPTVNNMFHSKFIHKENQENIQNKQKDILSMPYENLSRYRKFNKPREVPQQFALAQPNSVNNKYETVGSHLACDSYLQHVQGCEECLQSIMSMYHPEDMNYFRMYNNVKDSEQTESYSEMNHHNEIPIKVSNNLNNVSNHNELPINVSNHNSNHLVFNSKNSNKGIELNDIINLIIAVLIGILLIYGLDTIMKVIGKLRN
jgi:hypothetical protein